MATPDYYNILGVSRKATQEDIKKAYRGLAFRWHPDRNQDDKDAEQRFKDITAAYRCLSDTGERSRYDRLGPLYKPDGRPPRPEEVGEVASTVWGNIFRRRRQQRGEDLRYTVSLSLEEVAAGIEREVVIPRFVRCPTCGGDGADPDGGKQECEVCGGSGRASGPRLFRTDCYHCEGTGFQVTKPCPKCEGDCRIGVEDALKVKVPAGVATGQKLKLAAKGNSPRGSGTEGDLFVIVSVSEHDLFRRRGDDVLVEVPLTFSEVALGADVTVPTLEGTTTIRIPAGTPPGRVFRLAGRGLPKVGTSRRGDLHLQVALEVPAGLDTEQQAALEAWAGALPHGSHPQRAAFDRAVGERE